MNAPSLTQLATESLLNSLLDSLQANARSATFACGGSVKFRSLQTPPHSGHGDAGNGETDAIDASNVVNSIQVRFGKSDQGIAVVFPLAEDASGSGLEQLVSACQPATFGLGGQDVMDEVRMISHLVRSSHTGVFSTQEYRKAGKLDESEFATSFCPYRSGIVDIIAQLLLPQIALDKHSRSFRAELYNLNVYSAPSGKFRPHVDTPRSDHQISSLVVSLPADHEGGQLAVRHAGEETIFDWLKRGRGPSSQPCINWAAFYSDCEHEVYEVTSGHRITLTYNLYAVQGAGLLAGSTRTLDPIRLPLYESFGHALSVPSFFARGSIKMPGWK